MDEAVQSAAAKLVRRLKKGNYTITVAESCTGGLLASTLTDIAGASAWFKQSWVTYANEAKVRELGVSEEALEKKGAVSARVAIQMAQGALQRSGADLAIAITGIAGPGNDSTTKDVGIVYVGIASATWATSVRTQIGGNREENKNGFVHFALLSAMRSWDDAMVRTREEAEEAHRMFMEEEARKQALEAEIEAREMAAHERAPWQDEAWEDSTPEEDLGLSEDIAWSESEE